MAAETSSLLYTVLKIRRGELSRTALHFFYLLNVVGAFIIGRSVASALFLAEYDADKLAWMYVGSAVAVSLSSWAYSRVVGRVRLDRLIAFTTLILAVCVAAAWGAVHLGTPAVYPVLYVLVEVMGSLLIIQFWSFANTLHNTREAKRLFGVIGAGGVLANIIVGFGAAALVGLIGSENLLLVMGGNLLVCAALVGVLGRQGQRQLIQAQVQDAVGTRGKRRGITISTELSRVFASKHLRIIAGIVALTFVVTTLVDYQFKIIAKQTYDKTELTAFFSLLYGFTGILSVFIQLFVTGRLLERFGILVALSLLPLSLAGGSLAVLISGSAISAAIAKGADALFRYTVNDATTQLLYLPVPAQARLKAKAFIDGILKPVAYGFTGLALALTLRAFPAMNDSVRYLAIPSAILAAVWLALVFGIRQEYVKSLLDTLRRRRLNLHESRLRISDEATIQALSRALATGTDEEVTNALQLLQYVDGHDWDQEVVRVLDHESEEVRFLALEYLQVRGSLQYGNEVFRKFDDRSDRVRAAAITTYCAIGREKAIKAVRGFLADNSPAIRAAAMVGMIKYGGLDGVLAAAEALKSMLEHEDPELREHGARVLGAIQVRNFYQPIMDLLRDPEARVQLAAIESAGKMKSPELIPPLIYKLANKTTAAYAVASLASFGEGIEQTLSKVLGNELEEPTVRRNIPRILGRIGTAEAAEILCRHLSTPDEALRQRVFHALNRVHNRQPGLRIDLTAVAAALEREVESGFLALRTLSDLDLDGAPLEHGGLLASALEDKLARTVERMFLLLGVLYPTKTMEVIFTNLHSESPNSRANAIEVLDNTLSKDLKKIILPLVDESLRAEKLSLAAEVYGLTSRPPADRLAALLRDTNPWVVACALRQLHVQSVNGPSAELGRSVLEHLQASAPVVRETATWLVSHHLPKEESSRLLQLLREDQSELVRRYASHLADVGAVARVGRA